jgi:hypothetical protein
MTSPFLGQFGPTLTGQSGHKRATASAQFAAGLMALGLISVTYLIFGENELFKKQNG